MDWFETFVYWGYPALTLWAIEQDLHLSSSTNKLNVGVDILDVVIKGFNHAQRQMEGAMSVTLLHIFQSSAENSHEMDKPILEVLSNHTETLDVLLE